MGSYREHALEGASAVDLGGGALRRHPALSLCGQLRQWSAATRRPAGGRQAGAGHHHSPAGASAHGRGRPAGAGAQRVLRVDLRADSAGFPIGLAQKFEHAIECVRMCAMHGGRWPGTRKSIRHRPRCLSEAVARQASAELDSNGCCASSRRNARWQQLSGGRSRSIGTVIAGKRPIRRNRCFRAIRRR